MRARRFAVVTTAVGAALIPATGAHADKPMIATGTSTVTSYVFSPAVPPGPHVTHYDVRATVQVRGDFVSASDNPQTLRCMNVQTGQGKTLFHCHGSETLTGTFRGAPISAENTFHYTCDAQDNCTGRIRGRITSGPYAGARTHGFFTSAAGVVQYTIYVHAH